MLNRRVAIPFEHGSAVFRYALATLSSSRLLLMMAGAGVGLSVLSLVLTYVTPGTERRTFFDVAYLAVELLAVLTPILGSTVLQVMEFNQQGIWLVLVRPPTRGAYLWGRFWALAAAAFTAVAVTGLATAGLAAALGAPPDAFWWPVILAACAEALVVSALACLMTFLTTSYMTALVMLLGVSVLGYLSGILPVLASETRSGALEWAILGLYWLLPHLSDFAVRDLNRPPEPHVLLLLAVYAALYASGTFAAALAVFLRREV